MTIGLCSGSDIKMGSMGNKVRVCVHGFCGYGVGNPATFTYQCSSCHIFVITYPCGSQWHILIFEKKV